jgi:sulfatase modifying factor 1
MPRKEAKRIPTETQFSGSDNIDEVAWTVYNSEENIHPVAQKSPNELGIYDMTGNVSEWTNNIFDKQTRIAKGGSWTDDAANCAISLDQKLDVNYKSKSIGFRVCQDE